MSSQLFHFLVFTVSPYVIWLGLVVLYIRPLGLGLWRGGALALFFAAVLAKSFWYKLLGGHAHYPDFPELVCASSGIAFSFCAILFALSLLPPYGRKKRALLIRTLLAAAITSWGAYEGMRLPGVNSHEVMVEGLERDFDGLRLVQISDLHCGPAARRDYVEGVVKKVNALNADIIVFTGDLVDGPAHLRENDLSPLADLKARFGKYGCMGNHESYSGYHSWRKLYTRFGIHMLDNAHVVITNGASLLTLGGVTDRSAVNHFMDDLPGKKSTAPDGKKRRRWPRANVQAAFSNSPPEVCRILLRHRPVDTAGGAKNKVKLQLSGHTHGAPVWGAKWLIASMNEAHSAGFYHEHGLTLYVTPGTGQWVGFPLRLGIASEIALLTLRCKAK